MTDMKNYIENQCLTQDIPNQTSCVRMYTHDVPRLGRSRMYTCPSAHEYAHVLQDSCPAGIQKVTPTGVISFALVSIVPHIFLPNICLCI